MPLNQDLMVGPWLLPILSLSASSADCRPQGLFYSLPCCKERSALEELTFPFIRQEPCAAAARVNSTVAKAQGLPSSHPQALVIFSSVVLHGPIFLPSVIL